MRRLASSSRVFLVVATAAAVLTGCCEDDPGPAEPFTIVLDPATADGCPGDTVELTATSRLSDGTSQIVIDADWATSDAAIATVDAGVVTLHSFGAVQITASRDGVVSAPAVVTVLVCEDFGDLEVTPRTQSVAIGRTVEFSAWLVFGDGRNTEVTDDVTWFSGDTSIATTEPGGVVTGRAAGFTDVVAVLVGTVSASATVDVTGPVAIALVVEPETLVVAVGGTAPLTATAILSDDSREIVTDVVTWTSDVEAIATVDSTGEVSGVFAGTTTIRARLDDLEATAEVTVLTP